MLGPNMSRPFDNPFYSIAPAWLYQDLMRSAQRDVTPSSSQCQPDEPLPEKSVPETPAVSEPSPLCNLEKFLDSVTPSVPAQHLYKLKVRSWRTCDVESQSFFVLSDLWESFKEWSVYGAAVPLILNDHDDVVQYYVPYLSGIQLYGDISENRTKSRQLVEKSDGDSSSDGSSDSEQERGGSNYSKKSDCPLTVDQLAVSEHQMAFQEGFSRDEGESGNSPGCLLFEYLERDPPHSRQPLANKISDLALHCPELKTLRSCDLLPSSWISVAWYPIYRIPIGPTLRDLDASFLTYHSLHTPMTVSCESDGVPQISLPVFGLASYKYQASLWTPNAAGHQQQLLSSLLQAVDNWLKLRGVNQPDFSFFCRR